MSKRLILFLAFAFVVGVASATYAEVQNVKVSGDLLLQAILRGDWTLTNNNNPEESITGNWEGDKQTYFLRAVRVRVDADLTDNVSATVRLLNEGAWGCTKVNGQSENDDEVWVDLAYATLKEFLYSPLTLVLGRQELMFGNGMIVGDPDTNGLATGWGGTAGTVMANSSSAWYYTPAPDLSLRKAFDAIKAVLDYDPLVITGIYAKISETNPSVDDDTTLFGVNLTYPFDNSTVGEAYVFSKLTGRKALDSAGFNKDNRTDTIGARLTAVPVENLTTNLEIAGQLGTYNPVANPNDGTSTRTQKRRAWAAEAVATYNFQDVKYNPIVTGAYAFFSGERRTASLSAITTDKYYGGWDPMYENQAFGHIVNGIMAQSNAHIAVLSGKIKPADDVMMGLDYVMYWLHRPYADMDVVRLNGLSTGYQYTMTKHKFLGQELDLSLTYDYTEDVQFGLLAGVFLPGKAFYAGDTSYCKQNNTATELIGSMKVTF